MRRALRCSTSPTNSAAGFFHSSTISAGHRCRSRPAISSRSAGVHPRDNNWGQRSWKGLGAAALRERDALFAKLGGRTWEVHAVEVIVEPRALWQAYALQRACHFRYDVFADAFRRVRAGAGAAAPPGAPRMLVDVALDDGSTVVTATFPPAPAEPTPPPSQRARSDASGSDYDYDADRTHDADRAHDADTPPEFLTVIEWVAGRRPGAPPLRLPESQEVEGTLYLNEDPATEDLVFRVRFFGPARGDAVARAEAERERQDAQFCSGDKIEAVGTWWQDVEEGDEGF